MLENHTTKGGDVVPVAFMSNQHLHNYLAYEMRLLESKIQEMAQENDPFTLALYGRSSSSPEKAGKAVRAAIQRLYPYFAEAFLRGGYEDIRDRLRDIMRREGSLAAVDVVPAIELPNPPDEPPADIYDLMATPEYASGNVAPHVEQEAECAVLTL